MGVFLIWLNFVTQLLYASGDIAPQSGKNLQTFVWWEASLCPPPPPHHTNVCKITTKIINKSPSNLASLLI